MPADINPDQRDQPERLASATQPGPVPRRDGTPLGQRPTGDGRHDTTPPAGGASPQPAPPSVHGERSRAGASDAPAPVVGPDDGAPSHRHVWVAPVDGTGPAHAGLLHSWRQARPGESTSGWLGRVTYLVQVPDEEPVLVTQLVDAALITPARPR